jgi:hypothetical protein
VKKRSPFHEHLYFLVAQKRSLSAVGERLSLETYFWQAWLATVQLVLQADWQDVWHSPQPPVCTDFCSDAVLIVLMCLAICFPPNR